jgi:predicted site-specific integrase-resolvase
MFGTEIEVVNLTKEEDFQTELTQDLISIIHHRKELNALKKVLQQQKDENNQTSI